MELLGPKRDGFGTDISSIRRDELDEQALEKARTGNSRHILDLCCGEGAMARAFLESGDKDVRIFALDKHIPSVLRDESSMDPRLVVLEQDLLSLSLETVKALRGHLDLILWQRAIHYLPPNAVHSILNEIRSWLLPGKSLFVSASGFDSELGMGYEARISPLSGRFGYLSPTMQARHDIRLPVCLYRKEELTFLLTETGFIVDRAWLSPFGNVKVVAHVS